MPELWWVLGGMSSLPETARERRSVSVGVDGDLAGPDRDVL